MIRRSWSGRSPATCRTRHLYSRQQSSTEPAWARGCAQRAPPFQAHSQSSLMDSAEFTKHQSLLISINPTHTLSLFEHSISQVHSQYVYHYLPSPARGLPHHPFAKYHIYQNRLHEDPIAQIQRLLRRHPRECTHTRGMCHLDSRRRSHSARARMGASYGEHRRRTSKTHDRPTKLRTHNLGFSRSC